MEKQKVKIDEKGCFEKGHIPWCKGKHLSEEHKKKMVETRIKNGSYKHSEETRKMISLANKGNHRGLEFKKGHKINLGRTSWRKGKTNIYSKETIKKMSESHKGNFLSEEAKQKLKMKIPWNKGIKQWENKKHPFLGKHQSEEFRKRYKELRKNLVLPFKDTSIELKIQYLLSQLHLEYLTHKHISEITHAYQCDILIPKQEGITQKTIIECDGCFFHCCPICKLKSYEWTEKRKELDKIRTQELIDKGYKVIRLWEHEIKKMELNKFKERIQ